MTLITLPAFFTRKQEDFKKLDPGKEGSPARILLETTRLESWEISEQLAFQSPAYFSTQFKKCTGETPLAYRKRMSSPVP